MRIDEMPAGREMDKAISQYVFGNTEFVCHNCEDDYHVVDRQGLIAYIPVSNYSTAKSAAFPIAEKLNISLICSEDGWYAVVTEDVVHTCNREPNIAKEVHGKYWALADTIPLAICRAALKALGVTEI